MFLRRSLFLVFAWAMVASPSAVAQTLGPKPGDLYREFAKHNGGDRDWRVTDKRAVEKFEAAKDHLPNSRLELVIDDLEDAVRAEVMLDRWGGHRGTINKRIRFNEHDWVVVPELQEVPTNIRPEQLMYQDNPVVPVPLEHLREGVNVFEGDCDEEGGFGWGQWGLYSLVVRVYYDPQRKSKQRAISGRIVRPAEGGSFGENPEIAIQADAQMGVSRIDVLASYEGYDEDGDGDFGGYHESHFQLVSGQPNEIRDHVGTLWQKPYTLHWNTRWVPDQAPGTVSLIARIQDSRGYWTVTKSVDRLTLQREKETVRLYRAQDVPEDFSVRVDETKSCNFEIPTAANLKSAVESALHLRTWHGWDGHHDPIRINDHEMPVDGKNHFYDYDILPFPPTALRHGTNQFTMHSKTEHHMLETLWPGPAIVVRMKKSNVAIHTDRYQDREHFVVETPSAIYWLDRRSGGLSRLVDRDGNDWIAFKTEPWDQYPASAASAFRGLPNLLFGGDESGFGHPGWDRGQSKQVDEQTIVCTSESGRWRLRWTFTEDDAFLDVETDDPERLYWFLYEGPIAGEWSPKTQYFASNLAKPTTRSHDYFKGDRIYDPFHWAYMGDRRFERILLLRHLTPQDAVGTFSHLGSTEEGLGAPDGMVVFGFGRGEKGIEPLLKGNHRFQIQFLESAGDSVSAYKAIADELEK